jgi:hypothetical protein
MKRAEGGNLRRIKAEIREEKQKGRKRKAETRRKWIEQGAKERQKEFVFKKTENEF